MGIFRGSYYSAWMLFYFSNGFFLSLFFIGTLGVAGIFNYSGLEFGQVFGLYLLYLICSISFVLFLTTFFKDGNEASQIITFVQMIGSTLYFLVSIDDFRYSKIGLQITSILPFVCFEYTINEIIDPEN